MKYSSIILRLSLTLCLLRDTTVKGFLEPALTRKRRPLMALLASKKKEVNFSSGTLPNKNQQLLGAAALCGMLTLGNPQIAIGYNPTDYASETVQGAIQSLKSSAGDVDKTFKVYEEIAAIITEGKGVGGEINYKGVQLDRGYIADEDTSIYNPGLTLLTESEKERLVEAVIEARKAGVSQGQWNEDSELGYEFLRMKLDPYHMVELAGYLKFVPVLTGIVYLGVLAVQQNIRSIFPVAYFVGVAAIFGPAIALILAGP